jgi:hypothetical protein
LAVDLGVAVDEGCALGPDIAPVAGTEIAAAAGAEIATAAVTRLDAVEPLSEACCTLVGTPV